LGRVGKTGGDAARGVERGRRGCGVVEKGRRSVEIIVSLEEGEVGRLEEGLQKGECLGGERVRL
jgi:hypothetical protein